LDVSLIRKDFYSKILAPKKNKADHIVLKRNDTDFSKEIKETLVRNVSQKSFFYFSSAWIIGV
jgi:hypothetical protein